jgi:Uma2 family endonuclease
MPDSTSSRPSDKLTSAEFETRRADLPEAGRWHELHEGRLVLLSAPEEIHGTIVLNLSRLLAVWLQSRPPGNRGYACHGLGLPVQRDPDTLYFPAISLFLGNTSFCRLTVWSLPPYPIL